MIVKKCCFFQFLKKNFTGITINQVFAALKLQAHYFTRCMPLDVLKKNLNSIGVRDGVGGQGQYRVGRGSIGWAGAVLGRQGQYWLFHYQKSDFRHFE